MKLHFYVRVHVLNSFVLKIDNAYLKIAHLGCFA
jgi:hypothetical protein